MQSSENPGPRYRPGEEPRMEGEAPASYEQPHPETVRINRLLRQRDNLAFLCGEMLATLRLPANNERKIGELADMLVQWRVEFKKQSGPS